MGAGQFLDGFGNKPAIGSGRISDDSAHGPGNSLGFMGYRWDPEAGLWLGRNRMYSPEAGRWLQRDPAGYVDGLSMYLFVRGNPLSYIDPMGLMSDLATDIITGIASKIHTSITHAANDASQAIQQRDIPVVSAVGAVAVQAAAVVGHDAVNAAEGTALLLDGVRELSENPSNTVAGKIGQNYVKDKIASPLTASQSLQEVQGAVAVNTAEAIINDPAGAVRGASYSFLGGQLFKASTAVRMVDGIDVKVPNTLARVIPAEHGKPTKMGLPGSSRVFVTDAASLRGKNANQIADGLGIDRSSSGFNVFEMSHKNFNDIGVPHNSTDPRFIGDSMTSGGLREFDVPNGKWPRMTRCRHVD